MSSPFSRVPGNKSMSTLADNSRVRLSRDELHQLRWLLGLVLVLLAFWTLFGLEFGGLVWRALFFATAVSALAGPGWPGRIPAWIGRWSLILGAAALFSQFIATQFDLVSGLVLMVSLLALSRGLQYRRLREDWQLILLCLFIIVLVGVLTLSLLFGLQILLFTIVTMAMLFVMNLVQGDAGRALGREDWKNFHWPRFLRRVRGALDMRQLLQAAGLFGGLVLVGTIIFISMPRYQFEQSFSFPSLRGVSGFNDHVTYKDSRSLDTDDSVAFRVDAPPGISFSTYPYWRMIVLDEYKESKKNEENGFQLSAGLQRSGFSSMVRYPDPASAYEEHPRAADAQPGTWKIYLEGNVSEYLPVLGPFDLLTFSTRQDFRANEDLSIYRTASASPKVLGYEIESMSFGDTIPAGRKERPGFEANFTLTAADAKHAHGLPIVYPYTYFGLPEQDNDRAIIDSLRDQILTSIQGQIVTALAQQPARNRADVTREAYLNAVTDYLQRDHTPSMDMDLTGTENHGHDLLVRWMNTPMSKGWCEFYAGAFVLLARDGGYPARVVGGYKGVTFNPIENYYVVRQSMAHSWAEVFDGRDRWVRYDPSPGAGAIGAGGQPGQTSTAPLVESGMGAFLDSLRMIWYRRVINFDQTDQQELAARVAEYGKNLGVALGLWFARHWAMMRGWFRGPLTPARLEVLAGALLAAALAWRQRYALRNFWLRGRGWILFGRAPGLPPVRLDAGRWLRRFQPVWQARAPALPAPERAQWDGVRRDLLALRYGPLDQPPDAAKTFHLARVFLQAAGKTP
jgi:protein-glutamine gamma-glutamyltransferase